MLLKKYATSYRKYFRFPGLCFSADDVRSVQEEGYIVVGGDVYSGDGFETNAAKIVRTVLANVHPGCIVVFHMHGGRNAPETATALAPIVRELKLQGYAFATNLTLLEVDGSGR